MQIDGFPGGAVIKNSSASAQDTRDVDAIPRLGRSPGVGNGNLPQYSSLRNSMVREDWQAIIHGVTESDKNEQLSMNAKMDMSS